MTSKSGSQKKSKSARGRDTGDKDRLISGLKDRVAFLENELRLKNDLDSSDTSESNLVERALRVSEKKDSYLVEQVNDWVWGIDANGLYTYAGPQVRKLLGYEPEEIIGTSPFDYMAPEESKRVEALFNPIFEAHEEFSLLENNLVKKDGSTVTVETSGMPVFDANGVFTGYRGIDRDITERKRAEAALQESERRYRGIVEDQTELICLFDVSGKITFVNDAYCRCFGKKREELVGHEFMPLIVEEDRETVKTCIAGLSLKTPIVTLEERVHLPDGSVAWQEWKNRIIFDERGGIAGYQAVGRDITERKRVEKDLRLTQFSVDRSADMALWVAPDARFIYANEAACKAFGYTREEFLSLKAFDTNPYFNEKNWDEHWKEIKARGSFTFEARLRKKDGTFFPGEITVNYLVYEGKEYNCSYVRDTTLRMQAEEAVKFTNAYNRSLIEASLDPLVTISPDGKITDVNMATEMVTGISRDKLVGTDFFDYFTDPDMARKGYKKVFEEGSIKDYPLELRHTDGSITPVLYNANVYRDESGKVIGVFAAARDITKRKRAEESLMEAKAQAELYVDLMGHDINNMNQISMGFLELAHNIIEMNGQLGEENIVLLDKAMDSLKNSSRLIDSVRKLQRERMGMYEPQILDVNLVIEDAVEHFDRIPGRDVNIIYDQNKHYLVKANSLLKDVFINLIGNAIKHSRGPLEINIHTSHVMHNGKVYCRVTVEDDGPGITDEMKAKLFDRLSLDTTRARGKGFGLCLIKMLVDDYLGRFWVEDRIKGDYTKGARFVVVLPVIEK